MSADNWAKCPLCVNRAELAYEKKANDVAVAYGRIPEEEFSRLHVALRAELREMNEWDSYRTGREDWDIYGAETGTVTIEYGFSCDVCGLTADFKQQLVLLPADGETTECEPDEGYHVTPHSGCEQE